MSMKIQATIAGFAGQPITLVAVLDEHTGVLVVAKEVKYREERIAPDFALISNLDLPDLDFSYTDALMRDSIRAYYTRKAQQMLDLNGDLQRHEPDARIELEKVDESGRHYRIAGDIQNGQVAVLGLVAFVESQGGIQAAIEAADELADFYRVISI